MIKSDRQNGTRTACLNLTNEVFHVLWSHHIQCQRLQVPEVLLNGWILKSITPVDICKKEVLNPSCFSVLLSFIRLSSDQTKGHEPLDKV